MDTELHKQSIKKCSHTASCWCLWPCKEGSALQPQLVFTQGLFSAEARRMKLHGPAGISQHLRASGSQRCRAAGHTAVPRAVPAGPLSSVSQVLQAPFQVPSPQQGLSFHRSVHSQHCCVLWGTPCQHSLPVPARATAGGDFQFAFSLLFLVSPLRWGLRLWLRLKNQTPTKRAGKMIKHFPLCWMHCQLKYPLISAPFHLTVYGITRAQTQGSDVEEETTPSAIEHSLATTDPTADLSTQHSSVLCCPSPLSTSVSWVNGSNILNKLLMCSHNSKPVTLRAFILLDVPKRRGLDASVCIFLD